MPATGNVKSKINLVLKKQCMKFPVIFILLIVISTGYATSQNIDSILSQLKNDQEKADTLFSLSKKYFRKTRFDSAEYVLKKGMVFAEKTGNDELIARYMIEQGYILFFREDFKEGLGMLKKSYPYLAKTSADDLHKKYLLWSGRFYESLNHNDSALYYYHECEALNNRVHL